MAHQPARLLGALLVGAIVALVLTGLPGSPREGIAAPTVTVDIAFVYVTGEGPSAKAWYDGVPSPGVGVQDALDRYAKLGYQVARMTDNLRSTEDNVAYTILLQRVR
ncbi:MAG: hypothetical protein O2894_03345 [Planctomycetota bacterium]|nr:hypothetical protein [Planctomycetota bacterium]